MTVYCWNCGRRIGRPTLQEERGEVRPLCRDCKDEEFRRETTPDKGKEDHDA